MKFLKAIIVLNFLLFSGLTAQVRITFVDSQTKEKISEVQLLLSNQSVVTTDKNGEIEVSDSSLFPISISRVGYKKTIVKYSNLSEIKIELVSVASLNEINVTAKKNLILRDAFGNQFNSVKKIEELKSSGKNETKEVVQSFSELQLKDYGGNSGFQTFSARGTTASQNVIVIDGMIINDLTSGSANLSVIPVSSFELISLQTGGFSADISNGAFGSSLYLESEKPNKNEIKLNYLFGSFGKKITEAEFRKNNQNNSFSGKIAYQKTDGDFTFEFQSLGKTETRERKNNSSESILLSGNYVQQLDDWKLSQTIFAVKQKQGSPGPVFFDNEFSTDGILEIADLKWISSASTVYDQSVFRFSSLMKFQQYDYTENATSLQSTTNFYNEKELAFRADLLSELFKNEWNSGIYFRWNQFNSDQLNPLLKKNPVVRSSIAFYSVFRQKLVADVYQKISARIETASQFQPAFSASYSLNYNHDKTDYLISFSRMIRYPSFIELHFTSLAEPKLNSEKYVGVDAGIQFQSDETRIQLKGFFYQVKDKIISIPKNAVQWTTLNLDEVRGIGVEQNASYLSGQFLLDESLTLQSVKNYHTISVQTEGKEIVYSPNLTATFSGKYKLENSSIFLNVRYNGKEFYSQENLENETIGSFWLLDSGTNFHFFIGEIKTEFQFQIKNILNQKYEWVQSYPQPGRSYEFSTGVSL